MLSQSDDGRTLEDADEDEGDGEVARLDEHVMRRRRALAVVLGACKEGGGYDL
jgi:hypothetical protein